MGEETDIVEPMSSEDVVAAEDVTADEPPSKDQHRKRKKQLYKSLRELLEFYLGDVNLNKDRFMAQRTHRQPFVYVDLSIFLTFNKVRHLTSKVEDLAKALAHSELLQVSEDGTQVCRKTPIKKKENEDDCTIYVEQLGPDMDHDLLTKIFSDFGPVDYVSMPRFSHNNKFKGFAFVEFRDQESAKKALEMLSARGCCLSPHMAPEELMSIKNFDPNKENKKGEGELSTHVKYEQNVDEESNYQNQKSDTEEKGSIAILTSESDSKLETSESTSSKDNFKKERKKRKCSEESEKTSKKLKPNISKDIEEQLDVEQENSESKTVTTPKIVQKCDSYTKESPEVDNEKSKSKRKKKNRASINEESEEIAQDENQEKGAVNEDKNLSKKICKRKHSDDKIINDPVIVEKCDDVIAEPITKKLKSENEEEAVIEVSQPEESAGEDEDVKQKKKRKKRKKVKKEKSSAVSLGLKVLPKREWKQLRNKYLNMQRNMMRSLKQHLSYSKWDKSKSAPAEVDDRSLKPEDQLTSGTVVKITLEEPITNCKTAKSEMRVHPEVRYVDATEGSAYVYLRTSTPELAKTLVESKNWPVMEIIQGEEETEYWKKMKVDREERFKKIKHNQRGRTKLLKRAERYQGKHITTFEAS